MVTKTIASLLLGLLSGLSTVFLRLGVIEIPALALVSLRLGIASAAFTVAVIASRRRLPRALPVWRDIAVVAGSEKRVWPDRA